ncbi:MAG: glycosyltransferase [Anaerolineae bacterium]|nr:glycosyltransferase [Anaerolineae bacterium]
MKILHVIPSIADVRGGTSRAVLDMVRALRQANIDAAIATTNDNGPDLLDVPLRQWIEIEQVPVQFFARFSPAIPAVREFAFSRSFTTWLGQHLAEYDLLHVHAIFSYTSTVAMRLARLKGQPYLVSPHGMLADWSLQQGDRKKQLYLKLAERANLNQAQALHFTADLEQQEAAALNLRPPGFVIPLGLAVPAAIPKAREALRQHLQLPWDEPIILFMARLHPKKGLDYLISALSNLLDRRFTLVIAGSGAPEYEAEVKRMVVRANLQQRTIMPGFVQGYTKDLLLQGADLLALTSHSENFGIAILEALAAGTPVIVTPGVALAPVIQQNTLGYVTELKQQAIVQTLSHVLNHPHERLAIGQKARQFILENYTWDNIAGKLTTLYQTLLDKNATSIFYPPERPFNLV